MQLNLEYGVPREVSKVPTFRGKAEKRGCVWLVRRGGV